MGLEIVEQVPDVDAVVIPVGGGGLIAGTALAIKSLYPHVTIIVSTPDIVCFVGVCCSRQSLVCGSVLLQT